jgi:adenylosuccinate synthase
MGAIIVVDALWGDSGKGKIAAWLSQQYNAPLCARAGIGTNAGHSIYHSETNVIRTRQLPMGFVNPTTQVAVGSGVALDPDIFLQEVARYGLEGRAVVDYRCPLILPEHIARERGDSHLSDTVGSTKSGSGAARVDFILRVAKQAKDEPRLKPYLADVATLSNQLAKDQTIIVECSQGTYLSLALSPDYPYVTSDNCTATAAADDIGLNWRNISGCMLIVKAVPSRVGAGPLPGELSATEIQSRGIAEYGVVTGRLRRKTAELPYDMLTYASMLNAPTEVALTFLDHFDPMIQNATSPEQITPAVWELIRKVEEATSAPVTVLETGKLFEHIIDLRGVTRPTA